MAGTVVVQGTAIGDPYGHNTSNSANSSFAKGERQPTRCRDPIFAVLLYVNVAAIAAVAAIYGSDAFNTSSTSGTSTVSFDYTGYLYTVLITGVISVGLSFLMMLVMMRIPTLLIKVSLIFVVVLSGLWAAVAFLTGNIVGGVIGLIFFALGVCYARIVWERIPFASANLLTATSAVKNNCGVTIQAIFSVAVAFGWSLMWTIALLGVWNTTYSCTTDANGNRTCTTPNYGILFVLFLSYFFTHQVIQNTLVVIVAGVVGTWWFEPESSGCCSMNIVNSSIRAVTTSFGSICFGSLIVALIQALRQLANQARAEGDAGALACVAECILACIQGIVEYFNKWAYIYVGLYGYSYLEAGKNVFTLFKNRGWEAIIADDLVGNVLFLVSVVVGGLAGVAGIVIEVSANFLEDAAGNSTLVAFILGLIVGIVLCSIFMSTIASAVNAVIVLFAEAPNEFQRNYPDLSQNMREAWSGAYPGAI